MVHSCNRYHTHHTMHGTASLLILMNKRYIHTDIRTTPYVHHKMFVIKNICKVHEWSTFTNAFIMNIYTHAVIGAIIVVHE